MRTREDLSKIFHSIVKNVYFSPPSKGMKYPCIKYEIMKPSVLHADNIKYLNTRGWLVTVIDEDPDSQIAKEVEKLPYCTFDRPYTADGLNHFVYRLYF